MMHTDYMLINTHVGAVTSPLFRAISANGEIIINPSPITYTTTTDIFELRKNCRRYRATRVVADIIPYNHSIQTKTLYDLCFFLYYLGNPRQALSMLIQTRGYGTIQAYYHYVFRLQRLAMMSSKTPHAMVLTLDDLNDQSGRKLCNLLKLKKNIYFSIESDDLKVIEPAVGNLADEACKKYEYYLNQIRNNLKSNSISTSN